MPSHFFSTLAHLRRLWLMLLLAAMFAVSPARSQGADDSPHSDAVLVAENRSIRAGTPFTVALRLRMEPHWHSYWRNPGDAGLPTKIEWQLPPGFRAGAIQWPTPQRLEVAGLVSYAYSNEVWLLTQITPSASLPPNKSVALRGKATWLICKEECLPAKANLALSLPVSAAKPLPDARWSAAFAKTRGALPIAPQGWTMRAGREAKGKGLTLWVQPPGRETSVEGAQFFAGEASTIDHAKKQEVTSQGQGFRIALIASEYAAEPPKRLRGLLVAPQGKAWNESGARALSVDVPVEASSAFAPRPGDTAAATAGSAASTGSNGATLLLSLGLAFVGGLLLNLMPCVFPVLSLKVLSFVQQSGEDKGRVKKHGLAFGAGVMASFWVLAGALLLLRAGGGGAGWGFQLQSPAFVAGLALLLFGVGLNLLGAFEIGLALTSIGPKSALPNSGHAGYGGSFWSGVLATVVATPCTAPFMGTALGFALSQPPLPALSVFTALGLGMATPYVLLSLNPSWLKKLPRPGAWMETFKQAMAFPIFATVLWLAWVFGLQTGVDGIALLLGAMLLLGVAAWLWGRWGSSPLAPSRRMLARGVALASLLGALFTAWKGAALEAPTDAPGVEASAKTQWQPFSARKVEELQAQGRPVFVDFTAAWCITCQVNKRVTLSQPRVKEAFAKSNVALLRADWTRRDAEITRALERYGRSGVPTYVLLPAKGVKPQVLPEVLSETLVLNALQSLPRLAARPADPSPDPLTK